MPFEPGDSERARAMGCRSGQRRRRLLLEDVERELPPMDTPEHVGAGLQLLQRWVLAGLLPGAVAGACVRAAEAWLKLHEHELGRDRLKLLERGCVGWRGSSRTPQPKRNPLGGAGGTPRHDGQLQSWKPLSGTLHSLVKTPPARFGRLDLG